MDRAHKEALIIKYHRDFDSFRRTALWKTYVVGLLAFFAIVFAIIMSSWTIFFAGISASALLYFLLDVSGTSRRIDEISETIKKDLIHKDILHVLPTCTYSGHQSHSYDDLKQTSIFNNWLKPSHVKPQGLIRYSSGQYNLTISEVEIKSLDNSLLFTADFKTTLAAANILISPKNLTIRKRPNDEDGQNYLLYFKKSLGLKIELTQINNNFNSIFRISASENIELDRALVENLVILTHKISSVITNKSLLFTSVSGSRINIFVLNSCIFHMDLGKPVKHQDFGRTFYNLVYAIKEGLDEVVDR